MPALTFSSIKPIQSLVESCVENLAKAGITILRTKPIPYAAQIFLISDETEGLINIYFSQKKGITIVDCSRNAVSAGAIAVLRGEAVDKAAVTSANQAEAGFTTWIGTDESGKGDLFGPLVVAGFVTTRAMVAELEAMGVADSKTLTSTNIHYIGKTLYARFPGHINVVAPSLVAYNKLYDSFKNLNKLLAWGHARIIENLLTAWQREGGLTIDGAVADQFGNESYIRNALPSMKKIALVQRHGGESNIGVAAASIIARFTFEQKMQALRNEFGLKFPFGVNRQVKAIGSEFIRKYGRERLGEVAKLHFKTAREI
jgi:ribonuclease HIII